MLQDPLAYLDASACQGKVLGLRLGPEAVVLVSDQAAARQILITHPADFAKVRLNYGHFVTHGCTDKHTWLQTEGKHSLAVGNALQTPCHQKSLLVRNICMQGGKSTRQYGTVLPLPCLVVLALLVTASDCIGLHQRTRMNLQFNVAG